MHATDLRKKSSAAAKPALIVLHGVERHLKSLALSVICEQQLNAPPDQALGLTRFSAKDTDFKTVRDELQMVSMFSARKVVVVEDADDFVTQFRSQLEGYAEKPSSKGTLVLEVKTWRKNTRLAKKFDTDGLEVDCSELEGAQLAAWLVNQAQEQHGKQLSRDAAQLMIELAGVGMGLLDQELGKLASYAGDRERITPEDVRTLVGGWKAETTWRMIDAIRDGQPGTALTCLSKLLYAGEAAPKILGGINYVFRKYALATESVRQGRAIREALKDAGVFPREIGAAEQYLKRLRRPRAERIVEMLAAADYGLKGGSRIPEQMQLEQLILWLSGAPIEPVQNA